ncbi:MAG: 4-diphosphocytidyl-2C-methyl-D-erythritol kinase [Candidatus Binatia bacterium]|nr:MAG: 4-diphosphocytidyl-2C-methyl-D-erythritol kinase [Candidatus Binatia bacterium]
MDEPSIRKRWQIWSPAKVNFALYLRGRRADGYHLLESLVAPVSLFDRITIEWLPPDGEGPSIELQCAGMSVPEGEQNLVVRAVRAYAAARGGSLPRMRIALEKFIPVGAGLGGGSSDAAAVLWLLQRALEAPLCPATLLECAASLGSDVPFFLRGKPAIVGGVGEIVEEVKLPQRVFLVLCSDRSVLLTKDVYAASHRTLTDFGTVSNIRAFLRGEASLAEALHNDLEPAAIGLHPQIERTKEQLLAGGAVAASMTGSGSCVFGLCASWKHARQVAERLAAQGYWAVPAQTLTEAWCLC